MKHASLQKGSHAQTVPSQHIRSQDYTEQSPVAKSPASYTSEYPLPLSYDSERFAGADSPTLPNKTALDVETNVPPRTFSPNRRLASGGTVHGTVTVMGLTSEHLARHDRRMASLNPLVSGFTSPIGMLAHPISCEGLGLTELPQIW